MKITEKLRYRMLALALLASAISCRSIGDAQMEGRGALMAEVVAPVCTETKSSLSSELESMIETVTWAAYDSEYGFLVYSGYLMPSASGSCSIAMMLPEGRSYDIYAIANVGDLREELPTEENLMSELEFVLPMEFSELSVTGFPMAACLHGASHDSEELTLNMRSLVAAYDVEVNIKGLDLQISSNEWKRVMRGEYIRIRNSNRRMVPFSEGGSLARSAEDVHDGDYDNGFCAIVPSDETMSASTDSVFTYTLYVPENMQGSLLPDNDDSDRKVPSEVDLVNGPGVSERLTYLELLFNKTEASDMNPFVGEVIYRMYLGDDNVKDFSIAGGTRNSLAVMFDPNSLLEPPSWKIDYGDSWNNDEEHFEFSSHDITVTPSGEKSLFVWYSGTGVSLAEAIPRYMGIPSPDRVKAADRDEWFHEMPSGGDGMPGFPELWSSDPIARKSSDAIRYVAEKADKAKTKDVIGRYYLKAHDSMMGKTAMLVVSDRWDRKRDTCYVHFSGSITMNSSDFNNFRVAQQRTLRVSGLPVDSHATCSAYAGSGSVLVEEQEAGVGAFEKAWTISALDSGPVWLSVEAGGVSATFQITVLPVYLGFMHSGDGLYCTLDGAHNTVSYAYYADSACRTELSESSFSPQLKNSLLSPVVTVDGPYADLLACNCHGRQITTYIASYGSGNAGGQALQGCCGRKLLGSISLHPSYCSSNVSSTDVFLKAYRSYNEMGDIGTLYDASGYEPQVIQKVPGGLPRSYRTHVDFGGRQSFHQYSGRPIVEQSGMSRPEMWSVVLLDASGNICSSVEVGSITNEDIWQNGNPDYQSGKHLTATLQVRNLNSGEVFSERLFSFDSVVLMCIAGGYCNETGLYGKASYYEKPVEERPSTFYNSVTGATDWHDDMVLIQRDEWNTFVSWGGKIRKYLIYADDFIGIPANAYIKKTKYNLAAGLCFDTYADRLGSYSASVVSAFNVLSRSSNRFITGTVEKRYTYVEFDSSAATQLVLLKFHPSLYFGLMAYHSSDNRAVSDARKREEVYTSSHYEGVDDSLVPLSQTRPYALRTQIQHVFYGDVEDGLCNNQPWRVDFNHRSPSSIDSWFGDMSLHIPFSPDGDSSVDDLIGQFAPELTFSRGANISGLTFRNEYADYISSEGISMRLFFLHEVLSYSTSMAKFTWINWYD